MLGISLCELLGVYPKKQVGRRGKCKERPGRQGRKICVLGAGMFDAVDIDGMMRDPPTSRTCDVRSYRCTRIRLGRFPILV